jgi:glutamate-1-semialdehyde 2,1-aminomutase
MQAQLPQGTHFGAGHELEVRWAEEVSRLVPSAEQVKFTGSGTESTLLAIRIARSFTGRSTIVKLEGHFHGWHDYLLKGEKPPFESTGSPGIPSEVMATGGGGALRRPGDARRAADARRCRGADPGTEWWVVGDHSAIRGLFAGVRDLATTYGVVLIFDEVITGFRWAPGGAQQRFGVTPDLTTMAKIVAGGMPGGAVAGRREIMEMLAFKDEPGLERDEEGAASGDVQRQPGCLRGRNDLPAKGGRPDRASLLRRPGLCDCDRGSTRRSSSAVCRVMPGAKAPSSTSNSGSPYRTRPGATCALRGAFRRSR